MSKLYQTFQSPYCLHKSPQTILFHTTFLSGFVVKYPKTSSFFRIFQCRNSSLTKTTDSCAFLLKTYLIVVNLSNINLSTLSLNHSMVYVCCWQRNQRARNKLFPLMKTFLLLLTKSPNSRNFCFSLCFMSFFYFFVSMFRPIETTTANLQSLTHPNPSKSTNQVTLSNKHMNHLFWV